MKTAEQCLHIAILACSSLLQKQWYHLHIVSHILKIILKCQMKALTNAIKNHPLYVLLFHYLRALKLAREKKVFIYKI